MGRPRGLHQMRLIGENERVRDGNTRLAQIEGTESKRTEREQKIWNSRSNGNTSQDGCTPTLPHTLDPHPHSS